VCLSSRSGIALIASVMLIVFATIAVLGVVAFITQRLRQQPIEEFFLKTIYLAQAGVNNAVYYFRYHDTSTNGYFSLGQTNIDASNFFVTGPKAGEGKDVCLLMVNRNTTTLASSNRNIANWQLQNATNSRTVAIDKIIVSWNNSRTLQQIWLSGSQVWPAGGGSGSGSSGQTQDINNFTLDKVPSLYTNNYFRFSNSMSGATVSANFIMTDGSSTGTIQIYPVQNYNNFTVESTGKTVGSNIFRTIIATYNANTAKIVDIDESNTEITP
jgi:hypothetical protein